LENKNFHFFHFLNLIFIDEKLAELEQNFDLNELQKQLESVIESNDPIGYMSDNINWEIDKDLDDEPDLMNVATLVVRDLGNNNYQKFISFRKFIAWFKRNKIAKKIKRVLCKIADQIKVPIYAEAELKPILQVALLAIIAALGIGAINPVILTILIGTLATMILKGVEKVCVI
jgi:hypothetical protein